MKLFKKFILKYPFRSSPVICLLAFILDGQSFQAQSLYDSDKVQEIRITFPTGDWDKKLDSLHTADPDLRLVATKVILNGIAYDSAGIRYKGNSTYNPTRVKNPLNIKLDFIRDDQSYEGVNTLKLSNGFMDPSFLREALGYQIVRQYMPAALANFIKVFVNDTYLGLYTNVQDLDNDFLEQHFYTSDGVYFQCDRVEKQKQLPGNCPMGGSGSALKFISDDSACYQNNYEIESESGWDELVRFLKTLNQNPAGISSVLDVDRALWMLALNNFYVNLDSYSGSGHNYLIYQDEHGRFNPIMWDLNEFYGAFTNSGMGQLNLQQMITLSPLLHVTNAERPLISKLLSIPSWKKRYLAHLGTIMSDAKQNNFYQSQGVYLQNLVRDAVSQDKNKFFTDAAFNLNLQSDFQINPPAGKIYPGLVSFAQARFNYLNTVPELSVASPIIHQINTEPLKPSPQELISFNVQVTQADNVVLYYRATRRALFSSITLYDDGLHQDGTAGDGVYANQLVAPQTDEIQYYIFAENNNIASLSPPRAEYEFHSLYLKNESILSGEILINEFMASNKSYKQDERGDYDDWIELYNSTDRPLSLRGAYLSDQSDNLAKWSFPDTTILPKSFLCIWADEDGMSAGLHTNFKLSKSGEQIFLSNAAGVIDSIFYSEQQDDNSYGRCATQWQLFTKPSFAAANDCATGVNDFENGDHGMKVFPNPFKNLFYLQLPTPFHKEDVLGLYSLSGQFIKLDLPELDGQGELIPIRTRDLQSGLYLLKYQTGSKVYFAKVFVKD
ncbi:MAG: CotH kinase family protein [Saprospiraceae bacterium]|nr:CotH kinase family protein [Candidatus Vicinibacter affinis]